MMKVTNVKQFFPFDKVEIYHKDLGYAIPVDEIPNLIKNAEITHFAIIDEVVVAYAQG